MRTARLKLLGGVLVLVLALFANGVWASEPALDCYDGPFESVLLNGCIDDCRSFETLTEAEDHCTALIHCGGITKTAYGDNEAISLGVGLYEVRSGPGIEAAKGDTTWIKQVNCESQPSDPNANDYDDSEEQRVHALDDLKSMVSDHQLTPTSGQMCYSYSPPVEGKYINGCIDHCRSFDTVEEAMQHCNTLVGCGGVTHSMYGEGQSWHPGNGGYEVRQGPALKPSKDGDISWIRIQRPCDREDDVDDGFDAGFETEDWDYGLEADVKRADNSLILSLIYLVGFVGVLSFAVYASYMQGHRVTVDFVDQARIRLRQALNQRNASDVPGGSYESL
mmetsp:Transcript_10037/g.15701  ORF Transcript_10037/g.15701 Transcript_10037/m.15701 type:complete len:335 (+) Transcript_10037:246-1250(+)